MFGSVLGFHCAHSKGDGSACAALRAWGRWDNAVPQDLGRGEAPAMPGWSLALLPTAKKLFQLGNRGSEVLDRPPMLNFRALV